LVFIHKALASNESDSDCSFESEDILPSAYPVKPRKWSLRPHTNRHAQAHSRAATGGSEGGPAHKVMDVKAADEAFVYLSKLGKTKPHLIQAEMAREKLEQVCEVSCYAIVVKC
jgi:hypothetical protein